MTEREKMKLEAEAKLLGKDSFSFAFFMDKQKEERARGITITCATKEFFTEKYHYTIIDAPGHRDFIKNMVSGASQADVALLMVPAEKGGFETAIAKEDHKTNKVEGQTRQHARLCQLLGINQIIIGVNKMDSAEWGEERFNEIKGEMLTMCKQVGYKTEQIPVIPISGFHGDNLVKQTDKMPWYKGFEAVLPDGKTTVKGMTLLDAMNNYVVPTKRDENGQFRMPVSSIMTIKGVGTVVCGRIERGKLPKGVNVCFTNSEAKGKAFSIEMHHRQEEVGLTGENVGVNVKLANKDVLPKIGDVMYLESDKDCGRKIKSFKAHVAVTQHPGQLKCANEDGRGGYTPMLMVRTSKAACKLQAINWKMGKNKVKVEKPAFLETGDMAEVVFIPQLPLHVEKFTDCAGLGRVAVMDSNSLVMLGKVVDIEYC